MIMGSRRIWSFMDSLA